MTQVQEQQAATASRGNRDERLGRVVSDKGQKTITVLCEFKMRHPKYGKYVSRSNKLRAHDEKNEARVGDIVEVVSCRPISKTKCWRLKRVLVAAPVE